MSQTPRTPHARDNASLDPGQDADDADRENDDLYGDENVDTGREPTSTTLPSRVPTSHARFAAET